MAFNLFGEEVLAALNCIYDIKTEKCDIRSEIDEKSNIKGKSSVMNDNDLDLIDSLNNGLFDNEPINQAIDNRTIENGTIQIKNESERLDIEVIPDDVLEKIAISDKIVQALKVPVINDSIIELPEITIDNVVCSGRIGCPVDLKFCNKRINNSTMTKKFPALFIRLKKFCITLLLFSTGSVVATGGKSYKEAELAVLRLIKTLKKLNYSAHLENLDIQNLVVKVNMGFPIQITELCTDIAHSRYGAEQGGKFSCINYRIKVIQPTITVRIFSNGSVIFQSAKSIASVYKAVEYMVPVFHQFKSNLYEPINVNLLYKNLDSIQQFDFTEDRKMRDNEMIAVLKK